jgi:hypothetical protein
MLYKMASVSRDWVLRYLQGGTQAELAVLSPNLTSKSVGAHPGGCCGVAAGSSGSVEVRKDCNEAAEEFEGGMGHPIGVDSTYIVACHVVAQPHCVARLSSACSRHLAAVG